MLRARIFVAFAAALFSCTAAASAQQAQPAQSSPAADRTIHLDVAVSAKPGTGAAPLAGSLAQQDFTVLDNSAPRTLTSFRSVSATQEPVEVILMIDAVNSRFSTVAYEQGEIQKFLQSEGGRMAHPTTIAVLTDKGAQIQKGFSTDGNVLSHLLDGYSAGLREITRSAGFWGANERLQISLNALRELTGYAATLPGRKIVLWISPGWPLLSGVRIELSQKQQEQIFQDITFFSTQLREARITLYNINPRGVDESPLSANYYKEFVKGIRKPGETAVGNLGLQVLAVQSGGLVFTSDNDISRQLEQSVADTESWYELTFPMAPAERPNEYHHIEIRLGKPGLTARTRDGYYAQPESHP